MSEPIQIYKKANTGVFWDLEDYPIPKSLAPKSVYNIIKEALRGLGYSPDVLSIQAYASDKNMFSDELLREYLDAGIKIEFLPEEESKFERICSMTLEILFWALDNPPRPSNLIVLSKKLIERTTIDCFETLHSLGCGVLLSDPEPDWMVPAESSACLWRSLFDEEIRSRSRSVDNKKRKSMDTDAKDTDALAG